MFWTLICIVGALIGLGVFFLMSSATVRKRENSDMLVLNKSMVESGKIIIIGLPLLIFILELLWKLIRLFGH